jgi:hypothetical protein
MQRKQKQKNNNTMAQENDTTKKPEEKSSFAEFLAAAEAEQTAANNDLAAKAAAYKTWSDKGSSVYQKLLEIQKPEDNSEKINRNRRMAKTNAYTDFIVALTSGLIGTAGKGYAPKINDNASPYVAEIKNLQKINDAQNEKYKQLQGQVELANWEQQGKTVLADYEAAQKRAQKAEERGWDLQKMKVKQEHQKQLNDAKIQWAKEQAAAKQTEKNQKEAARKAASEKNRYLIGDNYEISYDAMKGLGGLYAELTKDKKVPKYTERAGMFGEEHELKTLTPTQMAVWLTENIRNEYVQDTLNALSKEGKGVYAKVGNPNWTSIN